VVLDLGSGTLKLKAAHRRLDDSQPHQVSLRQDGQRHHSHQVLLRQDDQRHQVDGM